MVTFNSNGIIFQNSKKKIIENIYTGKQLNYNAMTLTYDYPTDVFSDYGFTTCLRLDAVGDATKKYAFSYFSPATAKANTDYTVSFYAYNHSDAPTRIITENGQVFTNGNGIHEDPAYQRWDEQDQVIWCWVTWNSGTEGVLKCMLYPCPGRINCFTTGYQLIAGITIYEGTDIIRPSYKNISQGIYQIPSQKSICDDRIEFDNFIEY